MATQTIKPGEEVPIAPPDQPGSTFGDLYDPNTGNFGGGYTGEGSTGFGLGGYTPPAQQNKGNKKHTGPLIDPDWARQHPDKANALLLDTQFNYFKENYLPLEHEALGKAMDFDFTDEARRSGQLVANQFDNNAGMTERSMSRYGLNPTDRQLAVSEDARQRNRALGIVNAENQTRRQLYDRNVSALGDLASQGRGIASQAMQGMGKASALARQNKDANDALSRQHKAGVVGGIASGAGMGFSVGGPVGAVIGGILGGALGSI